MTIQGTNTELEINVPVFCTMEEEGVALFQSKSDPKNEALEPI